MEEGKAKITVNTTHGFTAGDTIQWGPERKWWQKLIEKLMFWRPKNTYFVVKEVTETTMTIAPPIIR
jgi:hypothetical protein